MLAAQVWRVVRRPASLQDESGHHESGHHESGHDDQVWWTTVFPLGMYSSATFGLSGQLHIPALRTVSLGFFSIGLTAWLIVALGLLRNRCRRRRTSLMAVNGVRAEVPAPGGCYRRRDEHPLPWDRAHP